MSNTTEHPKTVELGRYRIPGAERVLVGRRNDLGEVEVYDCCAERTGRSYFVERDFRSFKELAYLIKDYRVRAEELAAVPMSRAGIRAQFRRLDRLLSENGR